MLCEWHLATNFRGSEAAPTRLFSKNENRYSLDLDGQAKNDSAVKKN